MLALNEPTLAVAADGLDFVTLSNMNKHPVSHLRFPQNDDLPSASSLCMFCNRLWISCASAVLRVRHFLALLR
jgi:hypothetical protein